MIQSCSRRAIISKSRTQFTWLSPQREKVTRDKRLRDLIRKFNWSFEKHEAVYHAVWAAGRKPRSASLEFKYRVWDAPATRAADAGWLMSRWEEEIKVFRIQIHRTLVRIYENYLANKRMANHNVIDPAAMMRIIFLTACFSVMPTVYWDKEPRHKWISKHL